MRITKQKVVSIRYIMKNNVGDMLENTMDKDPFSYLHGTTGILPLLQDQLENLKAGDKKVVSLLSASGLTAEDFIFDIIVDEVREASEEEIFLGYPVKVAVTKCGDDCDCYTEIRVTR